MRTFAQRLTESELFQRLVIVVIAANAVTLTLEALPVTAQPWRDILFVVDKTALVLFWVEATLKLLAHGRQYWRDGWNIFDFTILLLTSVPSVGNLSALRALRILRALRLFSVVPQFRFIAEAFFGSIRTILATMLIIAIMTVIVSVMAVGLLGTKHPELFGTLPKSLFSMLQLMTLENWPAILLPVYDRASGYEALLYTLFFGAHFIVSTIALFNLLVAAVLKGIDHPDENNLVLTDEQIDRIAAAVARQLRSSGP